MTGRQAAKWVGWTGKQQASRQVGRPAGERAGGWVGGHAGRQADRQIKYRWISKFLKFSTGKIMRNFTWFNISAMLL